VLYSGAVASHLYDADGALLIRKDPSGTTLYAAGATTMAVRSKKG
jgi:hypothetical protein